LDIIPPINFETFNDIYYVMDMVKTDLNVLVKSKTELSNDDGETKIESKNKVKKLMYQLLLGVYTLHKCDVLHRDLVRITILTKYRNRGIYC